MTLLSEPLSSNTSGSVPDTAITDYHETDPREKGRDPTLSYDKLTTQNFDYTTILDRLRMVSWSNDSYPTGVVKPVSGSQPSRQSELRPNTIFLRQCLSWSAS